MLFSGRDDGLDGRRKAVLHGDDLIDAGRKLRQGEGTVGPAEGLDGVEAVEVEGDDQRIADRPGRARHISENLEEGGKGDLRLRRDSEDHDGGRNRYRTESAHCLPPFIPASESKESPAASQMGEREVLVRTSKGRTRRAGPT